MPISLRPFTCRVNVCRCDRTEESDDGVAGRTCGQTKLTAYVGPFQFARTYVRTNRVQIHEVVYKHPNITLTVNYAKRFTKTADSNGPDDGQACEQA